MSRNAIFKEAERIDSLLKDDINHINDLDPEDLDFSEYLDPIKPIVTFFIENRSTISRDDLVRRLLLVYSIEIAKFRGPSFWTSFFSELDRDQTQAETGFVFGLVWEYLIDLGCKPYENTNGRQLVFSLFRLTDADPNFVDDMVNFFIHYYKYKKGHPISAVLDKYSPCQRYLEDSVRRDSIINATKLFEEAFEYILNKHSDKLDNEDFLKDFMRNKYGIRGIWFSRKRITWIIREITNTVTPPQFFKILKGFRDSPIVHPKDGTISVRKLESQIIDYGQYSLQDEKYTVTPRFGISINDMIRWDFEKVQEYKEITYYKKKSDFNVQGRIVRRLCHEGLESYVWCGSIPIGDEIEIDGMSIKREGFTWNPKLKMRWRSSGNTPILTIETGNVYYYSKDFHGKPINIECGEQAISRQIDGQGSFSLENYHFDLSGDEITVRLICKLSDEEIGSAEIKLHENMLFSGSSRERITNLSQPSRLVKRKFGERNYYLFSSVNPQNISNIEQESIVIESLNQKFGRFYLYRVRWDDPGRFRLKIGEDTWIFESQRYVQVYLNNQGQFESIKDMKIFVEANVKGSHNPLTIAIFNRDFERITDPIDIDTHISANDKYTLNGSIFLDGVLDKDLDPGEYVLEVQFGNLIAQQQFYILPHVDVKWPEIFSEGEVSKVTITSLSKDIWDPLKEMAVDSISRDISGKVIVWGKDKKNVRSEDIAVKFSYVVPPVVKEISPKESPFVFGYRLYFKEKKNQNSDPIPLSELNYYDLKQSTLLVFSQPNDNLEIFINEDKVMATEIGPDGLVIFDNLELLIKHCQFPINPVKLSSHGIEKSFNIIWNPRIFSLGSAETIDSNKINVNMEYDGPKDSSISLVLKDIDNILDKQKIICTGIRETALLEFSLDGYGNSCFYYIESNFISVNGSSLCSTCKQIVKNQNFYIQVAIAENINEMVNTPIKTFEKEIDQYIPKIMSLRKPIRFTAFAKCKSDEILKDLSDRLERAAPKAIVVIADSRCITFQRNKIVSEFVCLNDIIDDNTGLLEKLFCNALNPIKFHDLIKVGLGLSSKDLLEDFESYIPKIPVIFVNRHSKIPRIRKHLIENYPDRTVILLEKGG